MRIYAVIDTNVLVSAMLKWSSVPGKVLEFALEGVITPLINDEILAEYREVLLRKKFHLNNDIVNDVISSFEEQGEFIDTGQTDIAFSDPKDAVFYEIVMEKRKETGNAYVVTGNIKHFPKQPFVVTPREMLDLLLNDGLLEGALSH